MAIKEEEKPISDGSGDDKPDPEVVLNSDHSDMDAPLEQTKVDVMLELTASGSVAHHPGLDLVAVLDISTSMEDENRMVKLKKAMKLVINMLTEKDRLSIVTFDTHAALLCGLRVMNDSFKAVIQKKIDELEPQGATNMSDGLKTGLRVLNNRRYISDRVDGIILMSDGEQNRGGDAADVRDKIDTLPVFTFGFGIDHDPRVLKDIAHNSRGGTFSDVRIVEDLSSSFCQILGGLVSVVVQDLELTVKALNSTKITKLCAGSYTKTANTKELVTVLFGDLFDKESRKIILELSLPATSTPGSVEVVEVSYTFSDGEQKIGPTVDSVYIERTTNPVKQEKAYVLMEKARLAAMALMKRARELAEQGNLVEAKKKLLEAQQLLRGVSSDPDDPLIKTLAYELDHLVESCSSHDNFKRNGLPFALSSETSHERQRFAARGHPDEARLFSTPHIDNCHGHAKKSM